MKMVNFGSESLSFWPYDRSEPLLLTGEWGALFQEVRQAMGFVSNDMEQGSGDRIMVRPARGSDFNDDPIEWNY